MIKAVNGEGSPAKQTRRFDMADNDVTRIAGNIGAMSALNALANINKQLSVHSTRLSTGKRINSAADDPAGLTIATKMQSRSEGLKQALSNIGDAKNLMAVAESGMGRLSDILIQMRNKAEAAASDTMGSTERGIIKDQLIAYAAQIDDVVAQTKWNGNKLIDGNAGTLKFQTGADQGETTDLTAIQSMDSESLGLVTKAASSSYSGTFDNDGNTTATSGIRYAFAGRAVFANSGAGMTELASGNYSVRLTIGSTDGTVDSTAQLFDSNGIAVNVDADGVNGGAVGSTLNFGYNGGDCQTIDFGNGLAVHTHWGNPMDSLPLASGAHALQLLSYSKVGTASIAATTNDQYAAYMNTVETAINTVNTNLSKIGALTSRLNFKEDQISTSQINVEASYNRIMNANMAEEQVNASKLMILQQTATSMLAQANAAPQFLLSLFK
jgi:flagellin